MERPSLERYVENASDVSLDNSVLMKMTKVSKHKRAIFAELEQIIEELADVKFIQRERDRRRRLIKVVPDSKAEKAG